MFTKESSLQATCRAQLPNASGVLDCNDLLDATFHFHRSGNDKAIDETESDQPERHQSTTKRDNHTANDVKVNIQGKRPKPSDNGN